jgi:glycosyltransferase involved in cell wall biosynthesis
MKKTIKSYFSIIIPTLNEEKYLPFLLNDLAKQTFKNFEVIVVDGNSDDTTVEKAKLFEKKLFIRSISTPTRKVSYQRNLGAQNVTAPWVIFMDADTRLPHYFLQGVHYQLVKHPRTDYFTTWIQVKSSSQMDRMLEQTINLGIEIANSVHKPHVAPGTLVGCKKTIVEQFKFDESQLLFEDIQFLAELHKAGYKFLIMRDPKFTLSLRRIKKEGNFKTMRAFITHQLRYISGGDFSEPFSAKDYPMLGGSYYETNTEKRFYSWFEVISQFLKSAPQRQLERARSILKSLRDLEL